MSTPAHIHLQGLEPEANKGWLTFGLMWNGLRAGRNSDLCRATVRVLYSLPVKVRIAAFSRMRPRSTLPKHADSGNVVTLHLGLDIPPGRDSLITVVGNGTGEVASHVWENGVAYAFSGRCASLGPTAPARATLRPPRGRIDVRATDARRRPPARLGPLRPLRSSAPHYAVNFSDRNRTILYLEVYDEEPPDGVKGGDIRNMVGAGV